jgi:hypothetical protein
MASKNEKAMGPYGHPWLPIPLSGSDLRATPPKIKIKIKIKKVQVNHSHYLPRHKNHCKSKGANLSREIWERSQKLIYALLMTRIFGDFWTFQRKHPQFRDVRTNLAGSKQAGLRKL